MQGEQVRIAFERKSAELIRAGACRVDQVCIAPVEAEGIHVLARASRGYRDAGDGFAAYGVHHDSGDPGLGEYRNAAQDQGREEPHLSLLYRSRAAAGRSLQCLLTVQLTPIA